MGKWSPFCWCNGMKIQMLSKAKQSKANERNPSRVIWSEDLIMDKLELSDVDFQIEKGRTWRFLCLRLGEKFKHPTL